LKGDLNAFLDHLWLDRASQVESLAHGAGGREQMVYSGQIHGGLLSGEPVGATLRGQPITAHGT
jgi:hypothetical protein